MIIFFKVRMLPTHVYVVKVTGRVSLWNIQNWGVDNEIGRQRVGRLVAYLKLSIPQKVSS